MRSISPFETSVKGTLEHPGKFGVERQKFEPEHLMSMHIENV